MLRVYKKWELVSSGSARVWLIHVRVTLRGSWSSRGSADGLVTGGATVSEVPLKKFTFSNVT